MWECEAGPGEAPPTGSGVSNLSNVSVTIQPIVASCCALISADLSEVELLMGNKGNISVYALLLPQISLLCSVCVHRRGCKASPDKSEEEGFSCSFIHHCLCNLMCFKLFHVCTLLWSLEWFNKYCWCNMSLLTADNKPTPRTYPVPCTTDQPVSGAVLFLTASWAPLLFSRDQSCTDRSLANWQL